jgi:hypothetical protein
MMRTVNRRRAVAVASDVIAFAADSLSLRDGWEVWRRMLVRAAGFPAAGVVELGAIDVARFADEIIAIDRELATQRARALHDLANVARPDRHLTKLVRRLQRGDRSDAGAWLDASPALAIVAELEQRRDELAARWPAVLEAGLARSSEVIRKHAADPLLREAVTWQTPNAIETAFDRILAAEPGTRTRNHRRHEQLVASYLQRYCVKNDTIGFFGPICWATLTDDDTRVEPGARVLRSRHVYWETWAIEAVAEALSAPRAVRIALAPRLVSTVALDGAKLRDASDRTHALPPPVARLLAGCDGRTPASALARAMLDEFSDVLDSADDVYDLLESLVDRKLVIWMLEPSALFDPAGTLRALVDALPDDAGRAAREAIARLDDVRAAIVGAAGDPRALAVALAEAHAALHAITGRDLSQRRAGETYAARTPLYEDCTRDLEVSIGGSLVARLAPALAILAGSARWFSHEIAARYRRRLIEIFDELSPDRAPIAYAKLWRAAEPLFRGGESEKTTIIDDVAAELRRRWAEILALDPTARTAAFASDAIAARARAMFAAPAPGWPSARHVSPDVMIAARGVDAIRRGEHVFVVGEVHIGNTLAVRCLVPHEMTGAVARSCERELAPTVRPVEPKQFVTRADSISVSRHDLELELGTTKSWRDRDHVVGIAQLVVERTQSSLDVVDASGRRFDIIAVLDAYLTRAAINAFRPIGAEPHTPRVMIDDIVVSREQWQFAGASLPAFPDEPEPRFLAVRRWASDHGMPRWTFVKTPEEPKPIYVDFASPIYVELFARVARKASSLAVVEMLPAVEDTWIPDRDGNTYTSELRLVMVDPASWVA